MITAEKLTALTTCGPGELSMILHDSGYTGCSFKDARFLGLTNGGQFCYSVTYHNENGEGEAVGKVFVTYDRTLNQMTADF